MRANFLLFVLTVITTAFCLAPLVFGWELFFRLTEPDAAQIYAAIKSNDFENSLFASIAVGLPICLEIFFIAILPNSSSIFAETKGKYQLVLILVALMIPNLLILIVAIPYSHSSLLICLIHSREAVVWSALMSHLHQYGGGYFDGYLFLLTILLGHTSFVMSAWYPFFGDTADQLKFLYAVMLGTTMIMFSVMVFRWFLNLIKRPLSQMSADEYSCCVYFVASLSAGTTVMGLCFSTKGVVDYNIPSIFLSLYNYVIALFTVTVATLHVRLAINSIIKKQQLDLDTKRSFVRFVSHEIRTPLNTVLVGLDWFKRQNVNNPEATEMVEDLIASCDIAVCTLNDLLNYDKIESGLMTLEFNCISALPFLRKSIQPFYVQARHAQVSLLLNSDLEDDYDLAQCLIKADENKLAQVIRNLISNAIKFTPKNGRVLVKAAVVDNLLNESHLLVPGDTDYSTSKWFRLEVVDTGAGISKENLHRVFKEIIQFNPGKLQQGGGSGLGLWISKAIVDLHGGYISVYSEGEGHGCTFTLELPVTPPHSTEDDQVRSVSISEAELTSRNINLVSDVNLVSSRASCHTNKVSPSLTVSRSKMLKVDNSLHRDDPDTRLLTSRAISLEVEHYQPTDRSTVRLLVVDDAAVNLKIMCRGLKSLGYTNIEQAEDGAQAVSLLRAAQANAQAPHVVLMDYQMPVMDGPTAAKTMREMGFTGKIYGVTGNALKIDIDFFLSQGADRVFTKPVSMSEIDSVIKEPYH